MSAVSRVVVLGAPCFAGTVDDATDLVLGLVRRQEGGYCCLCNTHVLVTARHELALRAALENAGELFADGAPVAFMQRRHGAKSAQRVGGPDLMWRIIDRGRRQGARHYFLGSTQKVLDRLTLRLTNELPGVNIAGALAPAMFPVGAEAELETIEAVVDAKPDLVWCAFGAPKQEIWMGQHAERVAPAVLLGVGAAFDFLAGTKTRAPRLLQESGLEWAHRLVAEPRRLTGRYVRCNSEFMLRAAVELLPGRRSG